MTRLDSAPGKSGTTHVLQSLCYRCVGFLSDLLKSFVWECLVQYVYIFFQVEKKEKEEASPNAGAGPVITRYSPNLWLFPWSCCSLNSNVFTPDISSLFFLCFVCFFFFELKSYTCTLKKH